jgi:hypothetical protein
MEEEETLVNGKLHVSIFEYQKESYLKYIKTSNHRALILPLQMSKSKVNY